MSTNSLRTIPAIEQLLQRDGVRALERRFGRAAAVQALRDETDAVRSRWSEAGRPAPRPSPDRASELAAAIEQGAERRLIERFTGSLRPVLNATGVIVHTNLGRAPLARAALDRIAQIAPGYSNLEYDLAAGGRGSRSVHAEALITSLTGAEAAIVVNNNAAAMLLVLAALAAGREVIVSRGELVEIGGGFRVPDVMAQSGAVLREVGTTNRTRVSDYAAALGDRTALLLRVHPSNFRIEGFTERPRLADLVDLGRRFGVAVAEDLGSGNLVPSAPEPAVQASIAAGVDLVTFSGDKLLGGPQAGIVAGRRAPIERLRAHPLMRALRVDKLTYAALEGTLLEYMAGREQDSIPVVRMVAMTAADIERRARAVAAQVREGSSSLEIVVREGHSTIGGGSAPGVTLPTWLLALRRSAEGARTGADVLEARLRGLSPPVIARIERDEVVLDLRTVPPEEDGLIVRLLQGLSQLDSRG